MFINFTIIDANFFINIYQNALKFKENAFNFRIEQNNLTRPL
jgi:hypothetical protein